MLQLAKAVYAGSRPRSRGFWHIRSQARRAFARFVRMALGSANELEYWIRLSGAVGAQPDCTALLGDVVGLQKQLFALHTRLTSNQ